MKLSVLFKRIQHAVIQMPELEEEMEIRGITCNSQKAEEDSLFVCIQGSRADGHDYIEEACNLGASCILIEKLVSGGRMLKFPENVAVVLVKDTREALAGISRICDGLNLVTDSFIICSATPVLSGRSKYILITVIINVLTTVNT